MSVNGGSDRVTDINFNFYFSYNNSMYLDFINIIIICFLRQKSRLSHRSPRPSEDMRTDELCGTMN